MAETFTGLGVGQAVTINKGVEVAVKVILAVLVGKAVITNNGVLVTLVELVMVGVAVMVKVAVVVSVDVWVEDPLAVIVEVKVGGRAEGLMEAASFPTVISNPQIFGWVMVAE